MGYLIFKLRQKRSKLDTNDHAHGIPELGPGLLPELEVVEKPGEMSAGSINK